MALAAAGDFDYKLKGADWHTLGGNELCKDGKEQSPINLNDWLSYESQDLAIYLKPDTYIDETTAKIDKETHTIKVTTT